MMGQGKTKVAMVEIAGRGGIWHYTLNLCGMLTRLSDLWVYTAKTYESTKDMDFHTRPVFNRFGTSLKDLIILVSGLRSEKFDIVHFQMSQHPEFVFLLLLLCRLFSKAKTVVTAHNIVDHENKAWLRPFFYMVYRYCDSVIVHSNHTKSELTALFPVTRNKTSVIPHGNYLFFQHKNVPRQSEISTAKVILFFGFIRRYKGLLNLIRAFEIVRRTAPEARLLIVGKPVEDFKIYADEIEERGIKDSVDTVLEYVPFNEIQDIFSRADIVALPYEKIYQSGVLQLAYAFGKPVVVTRTGGLPEAVDEGKTGFIVPPADPRELSKALTTLIKNSSLCREMGKEALKKAHTSFSWERIAEITDKLYRSILSSI